MGNFHTPWVDASTVFTAASMNPALASLDKAISYVKNIMVHCDGKIWWDGSKLYWDATINIHFVREDGQSILNTIASNASGLTINDNQFVYVTLNETNNSALSTSVATISTGSASNFKAVGIVVLAYRNTTSDNLYMVMMKNQVVRTQSHIADASTSNAITDPADAPADADALREDLVTNVIPSIESALNNIGTKLNSVLAALETNNILKTS